MHTIRTGFPALLPVLASALLVSACSGLRPLGSAAVRAGRITPADVRQRLYIVADDSMLGRKAGGPGNVSMTNYLAREARKMGLEPAGDNVTYFQTIPMVRRRTDSTSVMSAGNHRLEVFHDFAPVRPTATLRFGPGMELRGVETVFGGRAGDTLTGISPAAAAGKLVILAPPLDLAGQPSASANTSLAISRAHYADAAGFAVATIDLLTPAARTALSGMGDGLTPRASDRRAPGALLISSGAVERIMGIPMDRLRPGAKGLAVDASIRFRDAPVPHPARNVVAILRGADRFRRQQYVAVGAHSDHVGVAAQPVDHDSVRVYNRVMRPEGVQSPNRTPTAEQWARILAARDSVRSLRPPRRDSIFNGADDDGSGSVALLEIAKSLSAGPRPARSILFVWHTAEESGLLGSLWFTENPTVSIDSVVAQLNLDMVGRGGPGYLQVIGARRRSTELGAIVDSVNAATATPFTLDYSFDAPRHPLNRYCRSDHYSYARVGVPIAYFSRGHHIDYHVVTDEVQYVDYDGLARIAEFVGHVAYALANRPVRPVLDRPRPDPIAPCRQ